MGAIKGIPRPLYYATLLGLLYSVCTVNSANLHPNGGYDLVVAVEEGALLDSLEVDQERYIQNVKNSMQVFSHQLWRTTKQKFFVNSVELLLPSSWNLTAADVTDVSSTRDYQSADFRISSKEVFPYAENPHLCGMSGKFVELPLSFFKNANSNEFGPVWKTLLNLFARYRYGVWEEHGYVGDTSFPYYFQFENSAERSLGVTGCNNEQLVGKYQNILNNEECSIGFESSEEELRNCRFMPDRVQNTASTSLMHFHFMDSVVDFCDDQTHNKYAENKQNIYCDHQSVMEVIRKTRDFMSVTNVTESVPALQFKAVKQSSRPLLYLLLDKGSIQGSRTMAREVPLALASFLSSLAAASEEIVAAVGSYPSDQPGTFVKEEISWSQLKPNLDEFIQVVGSLRIDGPVERDFSRAILEVAEKIKARNHPGGAVVVVIKYGADLDNLSKAAPESELIVSLNEQNIILNSVELAITGETPKAHLSQVAQATYGSYATLTSVGEAAATTRNVLSYASRTLLGDYSDIRKVRRTIGRSHLAGISSPIPMNVTNIEFYFSSEAKLERTNFTVTASGVDVPEARYSRTTDWLEAETRTKFTYRFIIENPTFITTGSELRLEVNCTASCAGVTFARAEMPGNEIPVVDSDVSIEISTTNVAVDLSLQEPIPLFVKVTKSGIPVGNVEVEAMLLGETNQPHYVILHDDGIAPDVTSKDGVFAGYLLPSNDGSYKVSVTVKQTSSKLKQGEVMYTSESRMARLLPIDQGSSSGCVGNECEMENVGNNFIQVLSAPNNVVVANVSAFLPTPGRSVVLFLKAERKLFWLAPRVADPQVGNARVDTFELRSASSQAELTNNFDTCQLVETIAGAAPITPVMTSVLPITVGPTFYGVKAVYKNVKGQLSNMYATESIVIDPTASPTTSTTVVTPTGPTATPTGPTVTTPTPTGPTPDPTAPSVTGPTTTTPPPNSSSRLDASAILLSIILAYICSLITFN